MLSCVFRCDLPPLGLQHGVFCLKRILLKHNIFVNVIQGPSTLYFYPIPEICWRVTPPQATDLFSSCSPNTWTGAEHNPSLQENGGWSKT